MATKAEFIEALATDLDIQKAMAKRFLDAMLEHIARRLRRKEEVAFVGFGTFRTATRSARKSRNPRTGEDIKLPRKTSVRFKASKNIIA